MEIVRLVDETFVLVLLTRLVEDDVVTLPLVDVVLVKEALVAVEDVRAPELVVEPFPVVLGVVLVLAFVVEVVDFIGAEVVVLNILVLVVDVLLVA